MTPKVVAALAGTLAAAQALAGDGDHDRGRGKEVERVTIVDGHHSAAVTPGRELVVRDGRLSFDGSGALRTAPQGPQEVSGTVGLSAAANTVKIDPQHAGRTSILHTLAAPGGTEVPPAGITEWLEVSPYAKIRVAAANICTSPGKVAVDVRGADGVGWIIDGYELAPCEIRDRIYELPGGRISVSVWNATGAANRVFVQVFGR